MRHAGAGAPLDRDVREMKRMCRFPDSHACTPPSGVGIDAASTTVKRFLNGDARGRSEAKLLDGHAADHCEALDRLPPGCKTGGSLLLARLLGFGCDLDSRTRKDRARATVKVAMDESGVREQEAVPG